MENLYRLSAFQYVVFRKNTADSVDDVLSKSKAKVKYNARFKKIDALEFTDEYEFLNPNVKKVYVEQLSRKNTKLAKEEIKIRRAIENALKAERVFEAEQKKLEIKKETNK